MSRLLRAVDQLQLARPRTAVVSLAALCVMIIGGSLLPVPYVVERPGPAIDVLGEYEDEQILTISGADTYDTDGELMMTTVSVDGGPGYRVTPLEVVMGWFSPTEAVLPRELVFPDGQTRQETTLTNTVQMSTSQQGAVAVALEELGMDTSPAVLVAGVEEDGPAEGQLEAGDALVAVDGRSASSISGFQSLIADSEGSVTVTVRRDGEETDLDVPVESAEDGTSRLGVVLADGYEFPLDVDISVGAIGGPSAGLMFSLSVYDELTEESLTGGHAIAGTGTIAGDGSVGAIGGIRQKMAGAQEAGAEFFLAPRDNCDEVAGHEPDGLDVVAVDDFEGARDAARTIAATGGTEDLPTCEAP